MSANEPSSDELQEALHELMDKREDLGDESPEFDGPETALPPEGERPAWPDPPQR